MAKQITTHKNDPIFVGEGFSLSTGKKQARIELRIGESKRGQSRLALLTPREAQQVAIALMKEADSALDYSN